MQVQAEVSQVRSARTRWSGSSGSGKCTHSRAKSSGTSGGTSSTGPRVGGSVTPPPGPVPGTGDGQTVAMRLGVLDVGSNTVHLLVVDAHPGAHPTAMHDDRALLRLAEDVGGGDELSKSGEKGRGRGGQKARGQEGGPGGGGAVG